MARAVYHPNHTLPRKQLCTQPHTAAVDVTLPAFAAERRRLLHGDRSVPAAIDRYME